MLRRLRRRVVGYGVWMEERLLSLLVRTATSFSITDLDRRSALYMDSDTFRRGAWHTQDTVTIFRGPKGIRLHHSK
jgi:hypothetical protein